jgi:hypothetical protein
MQKSTQRLTVVSRTGAGTLVRHRPSKRVYEVPDSEVAALREDVILCRRTKALGWLDGHRNLLRSLSLQNPNSSATIGYLAQWADSGGSIAQTIAELLEQFPEQERSRLPLSSYLFLRLAEGVLKLVMGKPDNGDLDFVITVADSVWADRELLVLAHFWKAEAERNRGASDRAARHASQSRELAVRFGCAQLAARAQVVEVIAAMDTGAPYAVECLRRSRAVLLESEDWVWLGRIEDGLGRAAVEDGCYHAGLDHFTASRDSLVRSAEPLAELGWVHLHRARAQRLIAVRLASRIDFRAELRRRTQVDLAKVEPPSTELRQRLEHLRGEASLALAQAEGVFGSLGDARALAAVRLERGALWADCGDLQKGADQASECFVFGTHHDDTLLMAQARLLQSRIEKTYCEEELGVDLASRAQRAYEYAREALSLAQGCEAASSTKRRLLAAVYLCQGLLLSSEFFSDTKAALACCQSVGECLSPSEGDELWIDYQLLVAKTRHLGTVDARLRRWSAGLLEGKSFQQIAEEFADLVIPAVWAREGKNISRVVSKLAISPKKVRRILARVAASDLKTAEHGDLA